MDLHQLQMEHNVTRVTKVRRDEIGLACSSGMYVVSGDEKSSNKTRSGSLESRH
jgi:hypothetical protein